MSLRRLLGLSAAAVSGRLRRSLATAATHPPWAIVKRWLAAADESAPGALVQLDHPPHLSCLAVPKQFLRLSTRGSPDPDSDVVQSVTGSVRAASGDGLLLLCYTDRRWIAPILAKQGATRLRKEPTGVDPDHNPAVTHLVCNPVTGQVSRLPDVVSFPVCKVMCGTHMGLLTRAGRGHDGPPDRFAVAELREDLMARFLSETGKWESVPVSTCQLPPARRMVLDREVVAFGGRLWWLDATCGAISADPFSDRPELCFVELPRGSVLPAAAPRDCPDCGDPCGCGTSKHRRLCVSQGRLRYIEVSQEEPFLLSSFVLDDEGGGWTLEHRLDLSRYEPYRYGHPWLPLKAGNTPHIGFLDPLDANCLYMSACITTLENTPRVVFVVDMKKDYPFLSYSYRSGDPSFVPCVLPPWLGSSRIPSAGKKGVKKNKSLADVLVRAGNP